MKCPYCGAELVDQGAKIGNEDSVFACENINCDLYGQGLPKEIWQDLIDGKKAQRQLRTVKDRCVKKVKVKEREIDNYLNGISVRQSENERLAKQLKQAQDTLNRIWHDPNEKPDGRIIITERGEFYYDINGYYCGDVYWANNTPWAYLDNIIELRTITEQDTQEK